MADWLSGQLSWLTDMGNHGHKLSGRASPGPGPLAVPQADCHQGLAPWWCELNSPEETPPRWTAAWLSVGGSRNGGGGSSVRTPQATVRPSGLSQDTPGHCKPSGLHQGTVSRRGSVWSLQATTRPAGPSALRPLESLPGHARRPVPVFRQWRRAHARGHRGPS